ncbi:MAG TPA: hypothetical protein VGM26_13485 [Rhizomicrobium sp.]|jgi:hypothetical protein
MSQVIAAVMMVPSDGLSSDVSLSPDLGLELVAVSPGHQMATSSHMQSALTWLEVAFLGNVAAPGTLAAMSMFASFVAAGCVRLVRRRAG